MRTLAKPTTIIAQRRSQPVDALASTEALLRQREALPADHPDRARLRAMVIEKHLRMAKQLARRYAGRGEPLDDLVQVAALALIKAVDGYDPSRQIPFAGYAIPSILGALRNHFRDSGWGIRVPRSIQELALAVVTATAELSQRRGRSPTSTELADHLHVTVDDILVGVGAWQFYYLASLNAPRAGADGTDGADLIDIAGRTDPRYAGLDDRLALRSLVAALPPRERRIISMRFYGDMSQTEIAAEVGLSQMHVSRLLRQSLGRLRAAMLS